MHSPIFFRLCNFKVHCPFIQFWALEMIKPEKVRVKVAKVVM